MKRLLGLAAIALLTMPAFARETRTETFASDFQTVPVMANTTGAGGVVFRTQVSILNPTAAAFPIDVTLFDAAGTQHDAVITLAAGELKTFTNFLDDVFDYSGGGAVTFRSANADQRFVVNAEIWTDGGRYGTDIPALEFGGTDSPSFSPGIAVGSLSRTNVGCLNQAGGENRITATVLDANGLAIGSVELKLPANAWGQTRISTIVNGGYVRFTPSDSAVCYAVVVDNSTNDGRFIPAAEYRP
ncbi:MAG TPA: hypothetical protein VEK79_08120 [Thermoanaerobaculia bacterium]|nr:hypothetical protein [Thermoanaerobaculia bacterium]